VLRLFHPTVHRLSFEGLPELRGAKLCAIGHSAARAETSEDAVVDNK
jgi:hypothetical protein